MFASRVDVHSTQPPSVLSVFIHALEPPFPPPSLRTDVLCTSLMYVIGIFECTVPIVYSNLGYNDRAAYSDLNPRDEALSVHK